MTERLLELLIIEDDPVEADRIRNSVEQARLLVSVRFAQNFAEVEQMLLRDSRSAGVDPPEVAIVDTRSDAEYYGEAVRAARGGAVPGAVHLEWTQNLQADGRFKAEADLRAMYTALGVTPDREVMTYCQGGYRAAHTYLEIGRAHV